MIHHPNLIIPLQSLSATDYSATRHGETLGHFFSASLAHSVDRSVWHAVHSPVPRHHHSETLVSLGR